VTAKNIIIFTVGYTYRESRGRSCIHVFNQGSSCLFDLKNFAEIKKRFLKLDKEEYRPNNEWQ
jgi:hypothetical protein